MNCKPISNICRNRDNERGNAALIAMIFLAFAALTVLTIMASNSIRENRNLDKSRSKLHEKWQARSGANTLAQIVATDAPTQLDSDVRWARNNCSVNTSLPVFDSDDLATASSPAVTFSGTNINCANAGGASTSVFGSFPNWSSARIPLFESTGRSTFALDANNVKLIQLDEIYRRSMNASDVAYAVRFIVEAKSGNYRTRTNGELILGANLPMCGTSASLEVTPASVERGNSVDMTINYAYANHLQIYNSANVLIHDETVSEQSTPQNYVYRFAPATTDIFRVTATSAGGCSARSTNVTITVTDPPPTCPTITSFSASSTTINSGETVTLSWNVTDATSLTFEGSNVALTGSQSFTLTADRVFTLIANKSGCSALTQQISVTVRPIPPCAFTSPAISLFTASPASIAIGDSSTLTWNISGMAPGGTIVITGADGLNQAVGASGNQVISPPAAAGDYSYTIKAENVCPDGTKLTSQITIIITVRACPPPSISAFTVNPSTVNQFANQRISFAWNISGTADAVSISNGVGGGLPAAGTLDINQPDNSTTYTITVVGCGQTRQAQVIVTVNPAPPPPNFPTVAGSCPSATTYNRAIDQINASAGRVLPVNVTSSFLNGDVINTVVSQRVLTQSYSIDGETLDFTAIKILSGGFNGYAGGGSDGSPGSGGIPVPGSTCIGGYITHSSGIIVDGILEGDPFNVAFGGAEGVYNQSDITSQANTVDYYLTNGGAGVSYTTVVNSDGRFDSPVAPSAGGIIVDNSFAYYVIRFRLNGQTKYAFVTLKTGDGSAYQIKINKIIDGNTTIIVAGNPISVPNFVPNTLDANPNLAFCQGFSCGY